MFGFGSPSTLGLAALVVAVGAIIQGSIGFGLALWSAPLLVLIEPRLVPGPLMVATLALIVGSVVRERHAIDLRGVGWVLAGRVPGTLAGAALLAALTPGLLSILVGVSVLLSVVISLARGRFERTRPMLFLAGIASGVMGTTAGLGGPAVALFYQHEEGPRIRATLAVIFAAGATMSLVAIASVGQLGVAGVVQGLVLVPPVLLGLAISSTLLRRLSPTRMRAGVLLVASVGALLAIARGLRLP